MLLICEACKQPFPKRRLGKNRFCTRACSDKAPKPWKPGRKKRADALSDAAKDDLLALYLSGENEASIARQIGASRSTVRYWVDMYRVRRTRSVAALFWSKVAKTDACWIWNGARDAKGYGVVTVGYKHIKAHQLAWVLTNGGVPKGDGYHGTCVLHKCDNPSCVRPDHLYLGSNKANIDDMLSKHRNRYGENHHRSKLKDSDVLSIRYLRETTRLSYKALGRMYNVDPKTIWDVVFGDTWRHITMGKGREKRRFAKAQRGRRRELAEQQAALRKAKEEPCKDETTTTASETSSDASSG